MSRITKALAITGTAISLVFAGVHTASAKPSPAAGGSGPQASTGVANPAAGARSTAPYWPKRRWAAAARQPLPQLTAKAAAAPAVPDRLPAAAAAPAKPRTGT